MFTKNELKTLTNARYVTKNYLKYEKWSLAIVAKSDQAKAAESTQWMLRALIGECVQILAPPSLVYVSAEGRPVPSAARSLNLVPSLGGWRPIHLAALFGSTFAVKQFLEVDPGSVNAVFENLNVTPLMCAGFGGHLEILNVLISCGADFQNVHEKELYWTVYWTVKGGNVQCCRKLLMELEMVSKGNLNLCLILQLGQLKDNVEMLKLLLEHDGVNGTVYQSQKSEDGDSVLALAVEKGLTNCLEHLIKLNVPVNEENMYGLTPLFKAIQFNSSDDSAVKTLGLLIENGGNVTHLNKNGYSILRFAANKGFSKCVFKLIQNGAFITAEDLAQLNQTIPNFVEIHLNGLITMKGLSQSNSKVLVEINLRLTGSMNNTAVNLCETAFLNFLIQDGQRHYLNHPVIETFLTIKWIFVRKYFVLSAAYYILLLIFFTTFVMEAYVNVGESTKSDSELRTSTNNSNVRYSNSAVQVQPKTTLVVFTWLSITLIIFRILFIIFTATLLRPKMYFRRIETWLQGILISTMVLSHLNPHLHGTDKVSEWQNKTAAVAILVSWMYFLHYVRRQPTFGIYVEMLIRVFTNIAKFLLTYTCLLIGYAISFMVLYRKKPPFSNPVHAILRVLNMMVGEMSYDTLFTTNVQERSANGVQMNEAEFSTNYITHVFYGLFTITVTIALINLLIGLAVNDIKGLRKRSKLHKLMREVAFISDLEEFLNSEKLQKILHPRIFRYLQRSIHVQPTRDMLFNSYFQKNTPLHPSHHTVFIFPNNSNDKRLSKELKMEALAIAIQNQLEEDGKVHTATDVPIQEQLTSIQIQMALLLKRFKSSKHC